MDTLRVKWWGQKHLGSSYFWELSLNTQFQSHSTFPFIKLFMALQQQNNRRDKNKKVTENSGRKGDQSLTLHLRIWVSADAHAKSFALVISLIFI